MGSLPTVNTTVATSCSGMHDLSFMHQHALYHGLAPKERVKGAVKVARGKQSRGQNFLAGYSTRSVAGFGHTKGAAGWPPLG